MSGAAFLGFAEAVLIVAQPEFFLRTWLQAADYECLEQGRPDPGIAALGYGPFESAQEWVLGPKGGDYGRVRLLDLAGVPGQILLRGDDSPWDSGGILDLNVRVRDVYGQAELLRSLGWRGQAPPLDWSFGGLQVIEWLGNGPDGVRMALIQRVAPPLPPEDDRRAFGEIFNSSQVVSDYPGSMAFYERALGFSLVKEFETEDFFNRENVFGLPPQLGQGIRLRIALLKPPGGPGMLELISLPGLNSRVWNSSAQPPNRGVAALRFEVKGLDDWGYRVRKAGLGRVRGTARLRLAPYGRVQLLALEAPEGARIELFERCP